MTLAPNFRDSQTGYGHSNERFEGLRDHGSSTQKCISRIVQEHFAQKNGMRTQPSATGQSTHSKSMMNGLVALSRSHSPVKTMRSVLSQDAEDEGQSSHARQSGHLHVRPR